MVYLNSYSEFNEGWKNIVAGALIGLTTACQKVDLEDDLGRKLTPGSINDVAKVTFVDSLSRDKFRTEAKLSNGSVIYFDNPVKLDTGQTVYLHNDDIGRLLVTPVGKDFKLPEYNQKKSFTKLNFDGELSKSFGKWNKIQIDQTGLDNLLPKLKDIRTKFKSKYIAVQIDPNGNVLSSNELKSLKGVKPQSNLVILKSQR